MYLIETCLSTSWNWHFTPQYVLFNSAFRLYEFTRNSGYFGYPNGNSRDVQLTSSISMMIKFGLPLTLTTEMRKITTESNNMFKFRPECWWSLPTLNFYTQHRHTTTTLCHCWSAGLFINMPRPLNSTVLLKKCRHFMSAALQCCFDIMFSISIRYDTYKISISISTFSN